MRPQYPLMFQQEPVDTQAPGGHVAALLLKCAQFTCALAGSSVRC